MKNVDHVHGRISGSTGLASAADNVMMMLGLDARRSDEESKATVRRHRRFTFVGKEVPDQEMMIRQMENGGGWEMSDFTEDEVLTTSKQQQIVALLREAGDKWTPGLDLICLLEDTDKPSKSQRDKWYQILHRMIKRGQILSDGPRGKGYRLP